VSGAPALSSALQRRPSAALVIALLALFVAVGGPAEAARLIGSKQVKNRSLKTEDLSKKAVRTLQRTPRRSVGERALADGGVTTPKLRDGAVTAVKVAPAVIGAAQLAPGAVGGRELRAGAAGQAQIADGAITGAKVADGSLDSRDTGRFSGRFRVTVPSVAPQSCWSGEPVGLAPEQAAADISGDLVLATPDSAWPERELAFTVRGSANRSRFVLAGCNATKSPTSEVDVGFRYVVFDLP
jgi:hypothetical protein